MKKKIIVIPDSFKGSMSSETVAKIIAGAIKETTSYEPVCLPIADGGEGSTLCVIKALGGTIEKTVVHSPENVLIKALYGVTPENQAVIEIAESSGITRQSKLNPMTASTYGFGELINAALNKGIRKFLLCLGGSATTDCGLGMAAALGARFFDKDKKEFVPTGETLLLVKNIDLSMLDKRIFESKFTVMSDVENPLYGINGAAFVYGPQKGASEAQVKILDAGLQQVSKICKKAGLIDCEGVKGAGAAGGAGYGCVAFLKAQIVSGINAMLDICKFDELVKDASLIVTGEGKFDEQSLMGKVVDGIRNRSSNKPMTVFCGICALDKEKQEALNIEAVEIGRGIPLEESIAHGDKYLKEKALAYFKERERL